MSRSRSGSNNSCEQQQMYKQQLRLLWLASGPRWVGSGSVAHAASSRRVSSEHCECASCARPSAMKASHRSSAAVATATGAAGTNMGSACTATSVLPSAVCGMKRPAGAPQAPSLYWVLCMLLAVNIRV